MNPASMRRNFVDAVMVAALVSGCAVSPSATPSSVQSAPPTQTDSATPREELRLVVIGDSTAVYRLCECALFPDLYGPLASRALGRPLRIQNLAAILTTSGDLLETLQTSQVMRPAIEEADIIVIVTGINDIRTCEGESDRACYESAVAGLRTTLEAIHSEIETLQGDHPRVLRQANYYNWVIGDPDVEELGPSYQAFYAEQLAAINDAICEAVTAHGGICIDLLTAFNGPGGDQDAGALLASDYSHPSRTGHETIARELDASGYAPLAP